MGDIAADGIDLDVLINDQVWRMAWYPPSDPPAGTMHGVSAVCLSEDQVVLVSRDGQAWDVPAGRPEPGERWIDTLRREVREEACAEVMQCRLLGFSRGVCVRGPEVGVVLVRSMWRAAVRLDAWQPRFEIAYRRLVPADAALDEILRQGQFPDRLSSLYRRLFAEARP